MSFFAVVAMLAGTYLPREGSFDVSVWQTTGEKPFREILPLPYGTWSVTTMVFKMK